MATQPLQLPQFNMGDRVAWTEGSIEHKGRYIAPDPVHPDFARIEPDDERLLSNNEKSVMVHPSQLRLVAKILPSLVVMKKPQPAKEEPKQPEKPKPEPTPVEAEPKVQPAPSDPFPHVPEELKKKRNWVRWQLEAVERRLTKVPYQLNGDKASSTNPATWNTYEAVIKDAVINENQGIGIMTDGSFVGFDLDGCRNPETGGITPWARRIIDLFGTYAEVTPSGYGVRVYAFGQLPPGARRFSLVLTAGFGDKVGIECYCERRFFTVTGDRLGDASSMESSDAVITQAHGLCAEISREFPSEKRKQASQFSGSDSGSSVEFIQTSSTVVTSKLAVLMYGTIVSNHPFEIQDKHGNKVTAPSQSEADMSLATLLAMKHGNNPELIDQEFCESALYRSKWDRLAESQIAKAIASAKKLDEKAPASPRIVDPVTPAAPAATPTAPPAAPVAPAVTAQVQADRAAEASQDAEGTFPFGDTIPEFDESAITGVFRKLVDAICSGTTIPRQYGLHAAKALACSILTRFKIELEDCESARTYFIVFGDTGTGKGLSFRRMQKILDQVQKTDQFVRVIHAVDSEAGLRDAFFEIPIEKNRPILFFVDEVKTLGHKADGKKNPEIVDAIIELANNPTVSRTKSKKNKSDQASKTREDAWLLVYACAQDGEAYATAFPRTKQQGLPDRFMPEYSPKVKAGRLPEPDLTAGAEAIIELIGTASKLHGMTMSPEVRERVDEVWDSQPQEIQESPRLRQQFLLEMYLEAFNRGSAIAEAQDLTAVAKTLDRQKAIRQKFFTEEIPNQVGVYQSRLRAIREDMLRRLHRGADISDVALSVPEILTQTLAYKENDLPNFNQAWKAQSSLWVQYNVISKKNGHTYKKWIPTPSEEDTWLSPDRVKGELG